MIRVDILLDAVVFSNLLVLMSIGLTLTYMTLKIPNFAHGDFVTFGIYTTYSIYALMSVSPYITLPVAFLASGSLALALYLVVFRPLSKRGLSIVGLMIASIAIEIMLRSIMHIYADIMTEATPPNVFFRGFIIREVFWINVAGVKLSGLLIASTALVVGLVIALHLLLTKTKFGVAMRAAIENPGLASTLGINVGLVYAVSWFLAGGLAGVAGAVLPIKLPCDPETGWAFLLRIFAATILGGFSSIYGAVIGGYIVGFAEVVGIYLLSLPPIGLSTAYKPAISFIIIVVTLLLAPRGLTAVNWRAIAAKLHLAKGGASR
ncbi:MAG: branched-chain amino acid ABC transporter permease [Candidatus Methanomethylicota archaeon]|uniref:Branched-chain amino acid ABC transporter permease n=1 Tax=Thermoproteota archaeon TaxID=2056631 RepID=A0A497EVB9_9CREN|nr:MAG: branched-chain amino acid ABC transporter permease [Candidatus Verstraetearchaeota archaeon]